jgi:hypothetical protein
MVTITPIITAFLILTLSFFLALKHRVASVNGNSDSKKKYFAKSHGLSLGIDRINNCNV